MPKPLELIDGHARMITAIAALIAAMAGTVGAVMAALPDTAQLSAEQSALLSTISDQVADNGRKIDDALMLAKENEERLDARSEFIDCTRRRDDQIFDQLGLAPRCNLEMAR